LSKVLIIFVLLISSLNASAEATKTGTHYVKEDYLEEFLAPSFKAKVTNKIYRSQKVDVLELKKGWARISKYYAGESEGISGNVARWVVAKGLSSTKPEELKQPELISDARIAKDAFPKVGQNGLSENDIKILNKGAIKLLDSGICKYVEYGDKSTTKANTYYVNCGGSNLFFTP
jgi:hypothetical protein